MLTVLALFISCVFLSLLFTWTLRDVALANGWVSPPKSARHLHSRPVPRLGGVAVFAAFVFSVTIICVLLNVVGRPLPFDLRKFLWIVGPASIVFGLGLWDDIRSVSPWVKFTVQSGAAVLLYMGGLRIVQIPTFFGMHRFSLVTGLIATVFWVVWITNAFNLIDGVDGLAAGSALFSTLVVLLNALMISDALTLFITAALAGCVLGFLRYNFNPATIFLGDSGSLFIGFSLSALALSETQKSPTLVAVAIPVVALGLPIMDTGLSVARRFLSGKPLFSADREHIHHKLLEKGLTQRQVVLVLYAVTACFGLLALFLRYPGGRVMGFVLVIVGVCVVVGVQQLGYVEFFELRRVAQRTLEQRDVIINNLALRRCRIELSRTQTLEQVCATLRRAFFDNDFEGFDLNIVAQDSSVRTKSGPMSHGRDGLTYSWIKKDAAQQSGSRWTLSLELVTSKGRRMGLLSMYRRYCDRPLMADVNLLTSGFNTALADAVERAIAGGKAHENKLATASADMSSDVVPTHLLRST